MKKLIPTVFVTLLMFYAQAQNEEDLLRYSNLNMQGTARFASMGGAFGALGAEMSVSATNPAGFGRFKNKLKMATGNLQVNTISAYLNNKGKSATNENLALDNAGFVGVYKNQQGKKWLKFQYGLVYNKMADFNKTMNIEGTNNASFSYVLADRGNGIQPEDLSTYDYHYSYMAYNNYLINPVFDSGSVYYTTEMYGDNIIHKHTLGSSGRVGETDVTVSGNYLDKIYVGMSVGFSRIKYQQTKTYYEQTTTDSLRIDHFTFVENLRTEGSGHNVKIGAILLPQPWFRIGIAYHTPTKYRYMRDDWNTEISTVFKGDSSFYDKSLSSNYVYSMRTPGRLMASLAYVNKKYGVLTLEGVYVDYASARLNKYKFSKDNYNFNTENNTTSRLYQKSLNIKAGMEIKITQNIMARAGYAINANPFKKEYREKGSALTKISGGVGFRINAIFIDLAVIYSHQKSNYYIYDPVLVSNSRPELKTLSTLLSVGAKF